MISLGNMIVLRQEQLLSSNCSCHSRLQLSHSLPVKLQLWGEKFIGPGLIQYR